jgi:hypothetical protein
MLTGQPMIRLLLRHKKRLTGQRFPGHNFPGPQRCHAGCDVQGKGSPLAASIGYLLSSLLLWLFYTINFRQTPCAACPA